MKKALLILLFLNISCAPRISTQKPALYEAEWKEKKIESQESKLADFIGESYIYKIRWLSFIVGEVVIENLGIEEYRGKDCYHIRMKAQTNKILKYIFRVDDCMDSYIDIASGYPIAFLVKRREGGYRSESETVYDYEKKLITYRSLLDNSVKEVAIENQIYDPISCFYQFRTSDFNSTKHVFSVIQRAKLWNVEVDLVRAGILEIRKHGVLDAFLFNIKANSQNEKAKGQAWIWVAADIKKAPLLAQFNVDIPLVGTVVAALE